MTPEMQKQVLAALQALAEKLGESSAQVFAWSVRQSYINGLECVALGLLILALCVYGMKQHSKVQAWADTNYLEGVWIAFDLAISLGFLVALVLGVNAVDYLSNPQFWAIYSLLSMGK